MTLIFFAMFGTFFLVAQYFQLVLGYSPLESGLFQLPMAVRDDGAVARRCPGSSPASASHRVVPDRPAHRRRRPARCSRCMGVDTSIWWMYVADALPGRRHGAHHDAAHHADHVGGAARQGRRRLGHERHHPRARRRPRRRRARLARDLHVHVVRSPTPSPGLPESAAGRRPSPASPAPSAWPASSAAAGVEHRRRRQPGLRRRHGLRRHRRCRPWSPWPRCSPGACCPAACRRPSGAADDELELDELAELSTDGGDGRRRRLQLTPSGPGLRCASSAGPGPGS